MFRFLITPYLKAGKALSSTAKNLSLIGGNLKDDVSKMSDAGKNLPAAWADDFIEASGPQAAFKKLFEANHWTPERLERQCATVCRTKWFSIFAAWLSFCLTISIGLFVRMGIFSVFLMGTMLFLTVFFSISSLRFALFQTQIQLRSILSFKDFLSRHDLFSRIFLS